MKTTGVWLYQIWVK